MAEAPQIPDEAENRACWCDFAWTDADAFRGVLNIVFSECDR